MAILKSKTLFFTTSPRTPTKMIPEIKLLTQKFSGKQWNSCSQAEFIKMLLKDQNNTFEGQGSADLAFSARDRINRAPKALGFVDLQPTVQLTDAGKVFVSGKYTEEIILRQLLKFQLPSPYHKQVSGKNKVFHIKPYLEMLRIIYTLQKVTFDEIMIFGMQLTDYKQFEKIIEKILLFRKNRKKFNHSYKQYMQEVFDKELQKIFKKEIKTGKTNTRESKDISLKKFKKTKRSNLRDYTDACFRYLRSTGLVAIAQKGRSLSIMSDKIHEVEYILKTLDRNPVFIDNEAHYKQYLFNSTLPVLYIDNKEYLKKYILKYSKTTKNYLENKTIEQLKDIRINIIKENRESIILQQVKDLKSYSLYLEVIDTYNEIISDDLYDVPLMLEWNTWRAMTMLNGGQITGNFKIDDSGQPLSTAQGNMPDIECDYGDFGVIIEVTMQRGQRQYEAEGEPVAKHLAKYKKNIGKDAFCLFIAPQVNDASIAHFYTLAKTQVSYYGGKSVIVPIELDVFMKMVENSYSADFVPDSKHIKELFMFSQEALKIAKDEKQWYSAIQEKALNWLVA
ncbi:MAG: AlwI family type II restriction endonuclease [Endomicrobium sp.]|jgi:hypothetical protein|nr:AlwI family type II restriction endonuclease [Endomicrobium sp.]